MIQPVNALSPEVLFKGETSINSQETSKLLNTRKNLALINATGISVVLGAATTAIARSNTSSWKHAGYFGIGATLVSMMFLGPGFLYKSGFNTTKTNDKDVFLKEKKLVSNVSDVSNVAKNTAKTAMKSMPKI